MKRPEAGAVSRIPRPARRLAAFRWPFCARLAAFYIFRFQASAFQISGCLLASRQTNPKAP